MSQSQAIATITAAYVESLTYIMEINALSEESEIQAAEDCAAFFNEIKGLADDLNFEEIGQTFAFARQGYPIQAEIERIASEFGSL